MATTAKSLQIFKDIVSMFLGGCRTFAIKMMYMQIVFAAAMLACVIVTLQSSFSVATKTVIVSGFFCVVFQAVFVGRKPFVNLTNFSFTLTFWTSVLWAGLVDKILTALRAVKNGALWGYTLIQAHFAKRLNVLLTAVLRFASLTNPLGTSSGCVTSTANNTMFGGVWHQRLLGRLFRILT
jgi:hypothetical protein